MSQRTQIAFEFQTFFLERNIVKLIADGVTSTKY